MHFKCFFFVSNKHTSVKCDYHKLNRENLNYIERPHKNFANVPTDKADSNYAIILKQFRINRIIDELNNNKYYNKIKLAYNAIIKKIIIFISKKLKTCIFFILQFLIVIVLCFC